MSLLPGGFQSAKKQLGLTTVKTDRAGNERRSGSRQVQVEQPEEGFKARRGAGCSDARNSPRRQKSAKTRVSDRKDDRLTTRKLREKAQRSREHTQRQDVDAEGIRRAIMTT